MDGLAKALTRSRGVADLAYSNAMRMKNAGVLSVSSGMDQMSIFGGNTKSRRNYSLYRGWLYSAIHALASEAAGQPVQIGRMLGVELEEERNRKLSRTKSWLQQRMTKTAKMKTAHQEMELILSHPLLDALEQPNPIQRRWQFVYCFVANLNLTGWAYIVSGTTEDGKLEFYSLPTTWVRPDHKEGPFSRFRIVDPKKLTAGDDDNWLTRDQVAFAHLPNPSDPLSALAPAQSQVAAIRIDDHIQTSQERFFENGVFPSVVVTVGKDPHPDVPSGIRPRLTAVQRRQVHGAISKTMQGVANYGNPAIVDGMIENIERLSMGQNEMGWEKSERSARTRILSAFGVHPYILGEPVSVGGYAQAAKIEERFCKRVNIFLDMLGNVITNFAGPLASVDDDLLVWWEECESRDPSLHHLAMREARKLGDITRNEHRTMLGLSPMEEDDSDARSKLLDTVGGMQGAVGFFNSMGLGSMDSDQVAKLMSLFFQIPIEDAYDIVGTSEGRAVQQATETLEEALTAIRLEPQKLIDQMMEATK